LPHDGELPYLLVLSSGTTGRPKGPMINHRQAVQRLMAGIVNWGLSPWDRYASVIPLSFNMGRANCMTIHQLGGTAVMMAEDMPVDGVVGAFRDAAITWAFITPHHLRMLLAQASGPEPLMPFLRQLIVATAPLYSDERETARRLITPNFFETYGSNECGMYAMSSPDEQVWKPDSVGRIVSGVDAEIVDENHQPLPAGEVGAIRLRGPGFPTEYFNNPEATAQSFRDGWFYPGDAAMIDNDGFVFLKGRTDDVILFDGINVFPADIEDVLTTHPAVEEAAVVGHLTQSRREVPVAFVVLDGQASPKELRVFCQQKLAKMKWPHAIVPVKALPRSDAGKVLKTDLKKLSQKLLEKL
jgi:acyl-coenzyme A synthetase/AMP-(fatty) acid ligase